MWKLKGCPRCKGDLALDKDRYGLYEECLQCGFLHDLGTPFQIVENHLNTIERKEPARAVYAERVASTITEVVLTDVV